MSKGIIASAASTPYSKSYNIVNAVNYAIKWVDGSNPDYASINNWAKPNCASFASECMTAGGINIEKLFYLRRIKSGLAEVKFAVLNIL